MEPPFINRVWLQGQISTHPSTKALNTQTNLTTFQVSSTESWRNAEGELKERKNRITVEVVGKDSARVATVAHVGSWVTIEGYLRSEQFKGQDLIKIRTLSINVWGDVDEDKR
jgi:single-stranded DNA-binding protein